MKKYTESHEWIEIDGNIGTVGITTPAEKEIGQVVYIELPKLGNLIPIGKEACVLESTKAAIDIYSPVTGKIVQINQNVKENPGLINSSPEKEGWLFKITINNPDELSNLMDEKSYLGK